MKKMHNSFWNSTEETLITFSDFAMKLYRLFVIFLFTSTCNAQGGTTDIPTSNPLIPIIGQPAPQSQGFTLIPPWLAPRTPPERPSGLGLPEDCGFSNASHLRSAQLWHQAQKGVWPWVVTLAYENGTLLCTGALVSDKSVITTAHCVQNQPTLIGFGNLKQSEDIPTSKIIQHPEYNDASRQNDIALLELRDPIPLSKDIHPICLPSTVELKKRRFELMNPFLAGLGKWDGPTTTLLESTFPIIPQTVCQQAYKPIMVISHKNICVGQHGISGYSGYSGILLMFPVTHDKFLLLGVSSYSVEGKPAVFTRISEHMDWINSVIINNNN